jgi:biotin synthase-like enzyme
VQQALELFAAPFNDRLYRAHSVHRQHFDPNAVQLSTLLSIKAGGCFAGANSIFYGEKLLTTANPVVDRDRELFDRLGLKPLQSSA